MRKPVAQITENAESLLPAPPRPVFLVTFRHPVPVGVKGMGEFPKSIDDLVLIELTGNQPDLQGFIRCLMPGDPGVDDVVQQTNLVVWRKRSHFKPGTDFRAWMFAIARLEVLAHRKRTGRKSWLVIDEPLTQRLAESMAAIGRETPSNQLGPALETCLKRLDPRERRIIDRFYFANDSLRNIATAEATSEGALKVRLHRIRAALRRCIEKQSQPA